jgi:hypothetical protein
MMAGKHRKTYDAIYSNPVRANIAWNDAVAMAEAFGARVVPGGGSMFSFELGGVTAVMHRPHPGAEMSKGRVRAFRAFLDAAGADPDDL